MSEVDRIIDAGLGSYTDVEPRLGLERRVLARVRAREPRRRPLWFAGAVAAATVFVVIAVSLESSAPTLPRPEPLIARVPPAELKIAPARPAAVAVAQRHARKAQPPKGDVFPSPVPLTREERALLAWAGKTPQLFEPPSAEPLQIQEITIEPLNGSH